MSADGTSSGGLWSGFVAGAFRTSGASLAGTFFVLTLWVVAALVLVTPENVARHGHALLVEGDTGARATARAFGLRHVAVDAPTVILVGASDLQEAISTPADLERPLSRAVGRPVLVADLMSGGTLVWEMAALADCIPEGLEGLVVVGLSPIHLARGRENLAERLRQVRYGFSSDAFDEEVRLAGLEPPSRSGVHLIDHLPFYLAHRKLILRWALGEEGSQRGLHPFRHRARPMAETIRAQAARFRRRLASYEENRESCLAVLARVAARVRRSHRIELVVVETPRHPDHEESVFPAALRADHRERMNRFAQETGTTYVDFRREANLVADDYNDLCHLRETAAMERFTASLARRLKGPLLRAIGEENGE